MLKSFLLAQSDPHRRSSRWANIPKCEKFSEPFRAFLFLPVDVVIANQFTSLSTSSFPFSSSSPSIAQPRAHRRAKLHLPRKRVFRDSSRWDTERSRQFAGLGSDDFPCLLPRFASSSRRNLPEIFPSSDLVDDFLARISSSWLPSRTARALDYVFIYGSYHSPSHNEPEQRWLNGSLVSTQKVAADRFPPDQNELCKCMNHRYFAG